MSFFSKKSKDKHSQQQQQPKKEEKDSGKKSQFYVEFLGWMECRGIRGRQYTDTAIRELKRRQKKMDRPPKLTIQLTARELKISQDFEEKKSHKGKAGGGGGQGIKKVTFPAIPARDVTYVVQATRDSDQRLDDVVACIFLGYMPRTGKYVHVHVYRFDEPSTASTFAKLMGELVAANVNRINEVERDLVERGEIDPDPAYLARLSDGFSDDRDDRATGTDSAAGSVSGSGGYSGDEMGGGGGGGGGGEGRGGVVSSSSQFGSDDMDADLQSLVDVQPFDNVAEELKYRLRMNDGPLLLPPKDYDTISRARGNLLDINDRRCHALNVVGEGVKDQQLRPRNGSEESGIDLASPGSDGGDVLSRFPPSAVAVGAPGSAGPDLPAHGGVTENGFVYPPRPDRVSAGDVYPPRAAASKRYSPQGSPYGTRSSRTSHHSNHSNNSAERVNFNPPVYSRSNSSSSNPPAPHLGNSIGSGSGSMGNVNAPAPVNVVGPMMPPPLHDDEDVPPMDYPEDEDSFNEPVMMRRPGGSFHLQHQHHNQHLDRPRPHSGNPMGGSPMLMRSLPTKVLQSEMALHSPRSPRSPRSSGGSVGVPVDGPGDEYFFNAQRRSQPVYASHNVLDMRPRSADVGHAPRRVNSYR